MAADHAAVVALAAILSCGALIDGVNEFPGPWALVPVGATILFILSAANRMADPHVQGRMPAPNRLLAAGPFVALGAMAYSLYLWHWPLLIFFLAYTEDTKANFVQGAGVLLVSGVLAWLTTKYVEDPLRLRATATPKPAVVVAPVRARQRRPTVVLGTVVTLLAVALTASSFTWREHLTIQRSKGNELATLSAQDYPGARALLNDARVPKLPMRPTVLEAKDEIPETTVDGCITDFDGVEVIKCTYGDQAATRTVALAGGSHAEHWITSLDLLGRLHHFKVVTYLKMGCPLTTETVPLVMGDNRPYPVCHEWNQRVMSDLVGDHPDFVFTTSTRPSDGSADSGGPAVQQGCRVPHRHLRSCQGRHLCRAWNGAGDPHGPGGGALADPRRRQTAFARRRRPRQADSGESLRRFEAGRPALCGPGHHGGTARRFSHRQSHDQAKMGRQAGDDLSASRGFGIIFREKIALSHPCAKRRRKLTGNAYAPWPRSSGALLQGRVHATPDTALFHA